MSKKRDKRKKSNTDLEVEARAATLKSLNETCQLYG